MKQRIQLKSIIVFQSDAPRHLRRDFRGLLMKFLSLGGNGDDHHTFVNLRSFTLDPCDEVIPHTDLSAQESSMSAR